MNLIDVSRITDWHAHIYFDAASHEAAWELRNAAAAQFGDRVVVGRFHERPVGPHPKGSCQLAFVPQQFTDVVSWLALNHRSLDVFIHPNTGDELRDHRDCAIWLGHHHTLDLRAVGGS